KLLTVSQDPKDKADHKTITDALKDVKPWTTVRVLDDAKYAEQIVLNDPKQHEGVVLEAPKRATLLLTDKALRSLVIEDVRNVRVKGFRFRAVGRENFTFVMVSGRTPGALLERLDIQATEGFYGIVLDKVRTAPTELPLMVKHCTVQGGMGISVHGSLPGKGEDVASGIVIQKNRVSGGLQGIRLRGAVKRIQVVGNAVWDQGWTCTEVEDPRPETQQVLFANNTLFQSVTLFRIWQNKIGTALSPLQVECCNN